MQETPYAFKPPLSLFASHANLSTDVNNQLLQKPKLYLQPAVNTAKDLDKSLVQTV